jgi:rare lipoprotein A (peptidoglycan hydrolase)
MILRLAALAAIGLFGVAQAAAGELPSRAKPAPARSPYSAIGLASWYGDDFHGHSTADGETFDMRALSAAHKTMPLPSYARVTNLSNGRSIVVRVNDRGPYVGGRILDVSARVARLLEFDRLGVANIRLDYVGKAPPAGSDESTLLASLQTGRRVAMTPAPAPSAARPASDEGVSVVARSVELPRQPEPHSPYGELVTYPFLVRTAGP